VASARADSFLTDRRDFNPLMHTLKPHSNGSLCSITVIGTLAVDEWAFGTVMAGCGLFVVPQWRRHGA